MFRFLEAPDFSKDLVITPMGESSFSKEIRICMQRQAVMKEHTAPKGISIALLQGEVRIETPDESFQLNPGDVIVLEAKVPHSLYAIEASVIRLSLSKHDSVERVFSAIKP